MMLTPGKRDVSDFLAQRRVGAGAAEALLRRGRRRVRRVVGDERRRRRRALVARQVPAEVAAPARTRTALGDLGIGRIDRNLDRINRTGVEVTTTLFSSSLMTRCKNKLECFSMQSFFSLKLV